MHIDPRSTDWLAIEQRARKRMAELTEDALSITASDAQRREAVIRHDELQQMLQWATSGSLPTVDSTLTSY